MNQYKIEKNIQIPKARGNKECHEVLSKMKSGDSIFLDTFAKRQQFWNVARLAKKKITTRKEGTGFRLWVR